MEQIELLAPAKDLSTGIAAIHSGADAVYLGAARFGAREAAGNSLEDIQQLITYAHTYWAKVYVTLNTLLFDHELEEAQQMAYRLYDIGTDALIIQDTAFLEMELPPLPLFASTQMHNHTPERVAFLEQVGIQRVILARELSLEQIRAIRAQTQVELECFIHGALCVSYSGQCYLSYANGGRSGNRGQCAQPCRRAYSLLGRDGQPIPPPENGRYLLSLKDLNLSADLSALLDAGVSSFKIEGRLKDSTYVRNVVGYYRRLLDDLLEQRGQRPAASGRVDLDFEPDPFKSFNRGASTYFLHGRGAQIANPHTPKSMGEPIGRVQELRAHSFLLPSDAPELHPGDGLCFSGTQGEFTGTVVHQVKGSEIFPDSLAGLKVGVPLYRNHDQQFEQQLLKSHAARKIRVDLHLKAGPDTLRLEAVDEDGCRAIGQLNGTWMPAEQTERAEATIRRQMARLGGTAFEAREILLELDLVPFVPIAQLNALRRSTLAALTAERERRRPRRMAHAIVPNAIPFPQTRLTFQGNVLNQKAAAFYRRHGVTAIEPAAESGLNLIGRPVMTTKFCLRYQLNACPRQPHPIRLPEPLRLIDEQSREYPLRFNCAECVMEIYFRELPRPR